MPAVVASRSADVMERTPPGVVPRARWRGYDVRMSADSNYRRAVYVGSFDPLTLGHQDIIRRAALIFDQVTVGIGINPDKRPLFTPEERVELARAVLRPLPNVEVRSFMGLAVEFLHDCRARVMIRGVRTLSDIDTEFTMALANRALAPEIETVFLTASEKYTHISSSLIKQVAQFAGQSAAVRLREFVPEAVVAPLLKKFPSSS